MTKLSLLVIGLSKLSKISAGPGDDKTRVVRCYQGTATTGYTCGEKHQDYFYYTSCKFDEADYTNRPPVDFCEAGQQCYATIKNFDPNGSIIQDVKNPDLGRHEIVAEFGCGDSGRFKNDWTEYHNRFEEEGVQARNKYFGQGGICYGDDTDGTDLWSGTDFSKQDLTCYCLDDECNRQFELPYYIQSELSIRSQEMDAGVDRPVTETPEYEEPTETGSGRATAGVLVTDDPMTEEYSDDEDLTTERAITNAPATERRTEQTLELTTERARITDRVTERITQRVTERVTNGVTNTPETSEEPSFPETQPEREENDTENTQNAESSEESESNSENQTGSGSMSAVTITLLVLVLLETIFIVIVYATGKIPGKRTSGAPVSQNPEANSML